MARAAANAPEYDGRFGLQVRGVAFEVHSAIWAEADQLAEFSQQLQVIPQAIAKSDSQSEDSLLSLGDLIRGWMERLSIHRSPGTPPPHRCGQFSTANLDLEDFEFGPNRLLITNSDCSGSGSILEKSASSIWPIRLGRDKAR